MGSLVHFPSSSARRYFNSERESCSVNSSPLSLLCQSIPPERVGLNGEFDYYGLAKRVMVALKEQLPAEGIAHLQITQRGRVVVLLGKISDSVLLSQVVKIALGIHGTAEVETYGVKVGERSPGEPPSGRESLQTPLPVRASCALA